MPYEKIKVSVHRAITVLEVFSPLFKGGLHIGIRLMSRKGMCKSLSEVIPQRPLETEVFLERISRRREKLLAKKISVKKMVEFL
jgi:hypothetical protein